MTNLQYAVGEEVAVKQSPSKQIRGYPHVLEYRYPFHFSRMYVIENQFDAEAELLNDLRDYRSEIELSGWLDELFGEG